MFKNFAIAATAIALTAGAASAGSFIGNQDGFAEGDHAVELSLVRSDAPGTVVLETLKGDVLASADINAGANANVLLNSNRGLMDDVVAKLIINGEVADEKRIEVAE
ncbi:MAG: hypothetical protein MK180_06365 [Rhodobacteraceae bacterium]|nr:hypothetical protein [Paracoccaceae bacterium]